MKRLFNKNIIYFLLVALLMILSASLGECQEYDWTKRHNRPFVDFNKTWEGDDLMCWAYAYSSALTFGFKESQEWGLSIISALKNNLGNRSANHVELIPLITLFVFGPSDDSIMLSVMLFDAAVVNEKVDVNITDWLIGSYYQNELPMINIMSPEADVDSHIVVVYKLETISNNKSIIYIAEGDDKRYKLIPIVVKDNIIVGGHKDYIDLKIDAIVSIKILK
jgi:hypothetical protein